MKPILLVLCSTLACGALAQAPAPAPVPPTLPVIDPAKALHGAALLEALRKGGYVLFMRHARQGGPQNEEPCSKPNLVAEGEAQARQVGAALRELAIPVGRIATSRLCRAIETTRLLELGDFEVTPDLMPGSGDTPQLHAARRKRLAEPPPAGTNALLVSHGQASDKDADKLQLELAEIVVYRPDGAGGTEPVARVRRDEWAALRSPRAGSAAAAK